MKLNQTNATTTTTTTTTNEGKEGNTMNEIKLFDSITFDGNITFTRVLRSNERVLMYDIRCALIGNNYRVLLSLVKAWLVMVDKPERIDNTFDNRVVALARELVKIAYTGKKASVNERKDGTRATIDVLNTSRIKAWLYTFRDNRADYIAVVGERPAEKESKRKIATRSTIKIDGVSYDIATIRGLIATIK